MSAKERYLGGARDAVVDVATCLTSLVGFYPKHIEKEDKHFFFPCLQYFSKDEQDRMLQEFYEFDVKMIHEKYVGMVEKLMEQSVAKPPWA